MLREQHWKTNDIEQLDEAVFDLDTSKHGGDKRLKTFQSLKGKYVDTWRVQDASYFDVNSAGLSFGGLSVMVDWVVGMRTSTADRALKLKFPEDEMGPALLEVCDYLLWEEALYADWPRTWRPGIWDVSHSRLVDAQRPLDHMEERVYQCAAEFVALSRP